MALKQLVHKQWIWDKFYGGLGDYPAIISQNDLTKYGNESFSVDGRKEPNGIQLGQYFTTGEYIVSGDIYAYLDLAEFGGSGIISATKTGNIYLNGTLKFTVASASFAKEIYGISVVGSTVYYFTPSAVHTSNMTLTGALTENVHVPAVFPYSKTVIFNLNGNIFYCTKNIVHELTSAGVFIDSVLTLQSEYTITGITFFQDYLRIYSSSPTNGQLSLWNPYSGDVLPAFTVTYPGLPILGVDGDSGLDYAVMGYSSDYSDYYAISGTSSPQLVISNPEGDIGKRKFNGIIKRRMGISYLGGEVNGNKCLFSIGNYHKGYPQSLQVEGKTGTITAIHPRSVDILFGNNVGGVTPTRSGIQYIGDRTGFNKYHDLGEVVSLVFTGGKRNLKALVDVEICFDNDSSGTYYKHGGQVTLYARTKQSASWTTVRVFQTDSTSNPDGFVRIARSEFGTMGNFNQLELKLRLEPILSDGGSWKTSPLITSVTVTYKDAIKNS